MASDEKPPGEGVLCETVLVQGHRVEVRRERLEEQPVELGEPDVQEEHGDEEAGEQQRDREQTPTQYAREGASTLVRLVTAIVQQLHAW